MKAFVSLVGCITLSLGAGIASAQAPDQKPINLILAMAAGSGSDIAARTVAEAWEKSSGRSIIIENRPGALGTIAATAVANAEPDGRTLLMVGGTAMTGAPHILPSMPYDPLNDLEPITLVAQSPMLLVVAQDNPAPSLDELLDGIREKKIPGFYAAHHAGNLAAM